MNERNTRPRLWGYGKGFGLLSEGQCRVAMFDAVAALAVLVLDLHTEQCTPPHGLWFRTPAD